MVTFDTCKSELLDRSGPRGLQAYGSWKKRTGYEEVVRFVSNFSHDHLFKITSKDVQAAIDASNHSLGNIKAEEQMEMIEDFTTPFAFQHLFHWFIEDQKKVPTWSEFRDWMVIGGKAGPNWHEPLKNFLEENGGAYTRSEWSRAARWRLGKVYLSNIRELDLMVRLREAGVPLNYHLLADVLLRVDFWINQVLVCTYFPNTRYRDQDQGRKPPAAVFFEGADPPFQAIDVPISRQGFGNFWLATESSVNAMAQRIQQSV